MPRVVYEITAAVRPDLIVDYERFMREQHIPDLLRTGLFCGAKLMTTGGGNFRIAYETRSRDDLDRYLIKFAARLRQDFLDHFPKGVELSRAEWEVIETWEC